MIFLQIGAHTPLQSKRTRTYGPLQSKGTKTQPQLQEKRVAEPWILAGRDPGSLTFRGQVVRAVRLGPQRHLLEDDGEGVDVALLRAARQQQLVPQQLRCRPQQVCRTMVSQSASQPNARS